MKLLIASTDPFITIVIQPASRRARLSRRSTKRLLSDLAALFDTGAYTEADIAREPRLVVPAEKHLQESADFLRSQGYDVELV